MGNKRFSYKWIQCSFFVYTLHLSKRPASKSKMVDKCIWCLFSKRDTASGVSCGKRPNSGQWPTWSYIDYFFQHCDRIPVRDNLREEGSVLPQGLRKGWQGEGLVTLAAGSCGRYLSCGAGQEAVSLDQRWRLGYASQGPYQRANFYICQLCPWYHMESSLCCEKWCWVCVRKCWHPFRDSLWRMCMWNSPWDLLLNTTLVHFPAIIKYLTRSDLRKAAISLTYGLKVWLQRRSMK